MFNEFGEGTVHGGQSSEQRFCREPWVGHQMVDKILTQREGNW